MEKMPVVILNWNGAHDTINCVQSVEGQKSCSVVVCLIDNASNNEDFDFLEDVVAGSDVRLFRNEKNKGFGAAHNDIFHDLIAMGYDKVALLNNDAVADEEWLVNALRSMNETHADIVASKMVQYYDRNKIDSAGLFMLNTGEVLPTGFGQPVENYQKRKPVVSFCAGACLMKLSVIKEVGGFDGYFDTGYEDAELGLRAFLAGCKIVYEPTSVVYHKMGQSLRKVKSDKRTRKIQEDVNYTYLKLMPVFVILINFPFYLFRTFFVLFVHCITFRFSYLRIWWESMMKLRIDYSIIVQARKKRMVNISWFEIVKMQRFFLLHDLNRFVKYFLKNRPHKFES